MNESPSPPRGAFIAKLGAWLQLVALAGGVICVWMIASRDLDVRAIENAADMAELRVAMRHFHKDVGVVAAIADVLSVVGLVLVAIAITVCHHRSKWMFKFLCFYGLLIIVYGGFCMAKYRQISWSIPVGMFFLIFAQMKKGEFLSAITPKRKLPSCYSLDP